MCSCIVNIGKTMLMKIVPMKDAIKNSINGSVNATAVFN
jgi:hypothetical protein